MFPEWTSLVGFWVGATIGSFLNVVIYRLPRGLSIGQPRNSFCPNCKNQLSWGELIPILSWLFQRGKCKQCGVKISPRYLVVELVNGLFWAVIWHQHLVLGQYNSGSEVVKAVGFMCFASALLVAICTDIQYYIIPDEVNAMMLAIGLAMNVAFVSLHDPVAWAGRWPSSVLGALVGVGVLWGIAFLGLVIFRKDAMGHGDIKMARGIGAVLLWQSALASFGIAVGLGAVFGILMIFLRKGIEARAEAKARELAAASGGDYKPQEEEDDEPYEPESIGSLLFCGLGYVLCIDVIGLFIPRLYEWWFKENPRSTEEIEDQPEVEPTMIPFGPYLAAGALVAMVFAGPLDQAMQAYIRYMSGK
ncbi:MAG: prepilin peptidase [Armatimonadetes bacterium]|nr:prepilin peptidase [Armatimonadota bacterium]